MFGARQFNGTQLAADTQSWLRRVRANGGTVTLNRIQAVDQLVKRLQVSGLRNQIKRMNPMVGDALALAVPVWNDWGPALDILQGSPTVTADGMQSASTTKYLRTGVVPSTQAGWDSTNSHLGVHIVYGNTPGTTVSLAGVWAPAGSLRYALDWVTGSSTITMWLGDSSQALTKSAKTLGFLSGHRLLSSVAATSSYYEEGIQQATGSNSSAGKPTAEIWIGNANGSGISGDFIMGGYHLGGSLTAAQALLMAEIWHQFTQTLGRQRSMLAVGDSLIASTTWTTLYQSTYLHNATVTQVAAGGISSATCNTNLATAIATTPAIKWYNGAIWIGQNDSGTSYGQTTINNTILIQSQMPHNSFRIVGMFWINVVNNWTGQAVRATKQTVTDFFKARQRELEFNGPLQSAGGTGVTGTVAQDARDVANGVLPSSYHLDTAAPASISAITKANPAQVTATAHGGVTGDTFYCSAATGGMTQIQNLYSTVTVIDANTFTMDFIDSTGFTTYTSGGTAVKKDATHQNPAADAILATALNASVSGGWNT